MIQDAPLAIARQTYAAAQRCRSLKARATLFVEAIAPLMDFDAIDAIARQEGAWLRRVYPNIDTLGTKLSSAGYYKNLKRLLLSAGKNAEPVERRDATGQVIGTRLQHRALRWIGLNPEEWNRRNGSTRVLERLTPQGDKCPIDPLQYLTLADRLLDSTRWTEMAAGLVAATGRRPVEVMARGQFAVVRGDRLQFTGQAKKRGLTPLFEIATLLPAARVVAALGRLRAHPTVARVLAECGEDNGAVDRRFNASINRAVRSHFSDVLPQRQVQSRSRVNCQGLRAAYAVLVVQRDCPAASPAAAMLYAARQLGHFVEGEEPNDRDLVHLLTTLGYTDYEVAGPVPHWPLTAAAKAAIAADQADSAAEPGVGEGREQPEIPDLVLPPAAKVTTEAASEAATETAAEAAIEAAAAPPPRIAIAAADHHWLLRQCEQWACDEAGAIARLVDFYRTHQAPAAAISDATPPITPLANQVAHNAAAIAALGEQLTALQGAIAALREPITPPPTVPPARQTPTRAKATPRKTARTPPGSRKTAAPKSNPKSNQTKPNPSGKGRSRQRPLELDNGPPLDSNHLFGLSGCKLSRTRAASQARIDRCVRAIMAWNDQSDRKWAINGRAIRDLMPCTIAPTLVSQWLRDRAATLAAHHRRHGIDNPTYYNRTHRKQGIAAQIRQEVWPLVETLDPATAEIPPD